MGLLGMMSFTELGSLLFAFLLAFTISATLSRGIRRRLTTSSSFWVTLLLGNYVFGWIYGAFLVIIGFGLMFACGPSGMCLLVLFGYIPVLVVAGIVGLILFFVSLKIIPIKQIATFFTRTEGWLFFLSCVIFLIFAVVFQKNIYEARTPLPANISATIDSNSLAISSLTPTISGTASGVDTIEVWLDDRSSGGYEFWTNDTVRVVNGRWSVTAEIPPERIARKKPIFVSVNVRRSENTIAQLIRDELLIANTSVVDPLSETKSTTDTNSVPSKSVTKLQLESSSNSPVIKIISPNGGETLKIGDKVRINWEANPPPGVWLDLELFEISGDKPSIAPSGQCLNCIGGGLRSGVQAISPIMNGAGGIDWEVGKLYAGGYVKAGNHYILKANISKTGSPNECPAKFAGCTIDLGVDWSDAVFSLTNY